jgi:hypothetical protein
LETSEIIKELCVLSLKIKSGNKAGTEEVGVIIVPSDELAKKPDNEIQKELESEVKRLSKDNLAEYKTPTVVVFRREDLPKTSVNTSSSLRFDTVRQLRARFFSPVIIQISLKLYLTRSLR